MNLYGVELIAEGDMVVQAYQRNGGAFEVGSLYAWLQTASQPGAVCLDVGAYTGLYGLLARQQGASVYAFEPNPANYERMVDNVANNPGPGLLSCFNAAVGQGPGQGELWDTKGRPRLTSAGKVCESLNGGLEILTIDGLQLSRCDVIKADVEGAELSVLRGAARTIAGFLPCLILEANSEAEREDLDAELSQYGYGPGVRADVRNLIYNHPDR